MKRKRVWEIGAGAALVLVLAVTLAGWLHHKSLNDALARLLENPNLDRQDRQAVHRLLSKGASIHTKRSDGYNVLMLAARNGDLPLLREAMQRGISVNSRDDGGQTPLFDVMAARDAECLQALIAAGADVNAQDAAGRTPLMWAAEFKFRGGINLLLLHGADVNARNRKGQTLLAYVGRHPGLIRLLKQHGAAK